MPKDKSQKKNLNKELSQILSKKETLQVEDMERLSVLYAWINRPDKSKYYLNRIEKHKRRTATNPGQAGSKTYGESSSGQEDGVS